VRLFQALVGCAVEVPDATGALHLPICSRHTSSSERRVGLAKLVRFGPLLEMTDVTPAAGLRRLHPEMPAEPGIRTAATDDAARGTKPGRPRAEG